MCLRCLNNFWQLKYKKKKKKRFKIPCSFNDCNAVNLSIYKKNRNRETVVYLFSWGIESTMMLKETENLVRNTRERLF